MKNVQNLYEMRALVANSGVVLIPVLGRLFCVAKKKLELIGDCSAIVLSLRVRKSDFVRSVIWFR